MSESRAVNERKQEKQKQFQALVTMSTFTDKMRITKWKSAV